MNPTEAGAELDQFIAEKVFGLVYCQGEHKGAELPCYADPKDPTNGAPLRGYSSDLSAAWAAVEKADLFRYDCRSLIRNEGGLWEVRDIDYQAGDWETLATGNTAPTVLCLAILTELTPKGAPAAPTENPSHILKIGPINGNVFAGKSLIQTLREHPSDAKKTGEMTAIAPAARPEFSSLKGEVAPDLPPMHSDAVSRRSLSRGAKKKRKKKASAPAASTRISKRKKK